MRAEIELPPLPDGWANGPVEISYGVPPVGSLLLHGQWSGTCVYEGGSYIYAVRKWQPAIVTAGVLAPGWVVIDEDGSYWWGRGKPAWSEDCRKWLGLVAEIHLSETPQITGRNAIWEVK